MEKLTDKYLWKSLKEGDLNAFAVLFETYYPLLHSYGLKISGNYTIENKRTEEVSTINVEGTDYPVLDRSNLALMFTSRPKTKWILGANYDMNKWGLALNNTYFGKTTC
jgi:hypothetical protein